jgi:histidinol phosphatase-like enzyme (inositol monophosphatase family)
MSPRLAFAVETAYVAGRSTLAHFGTVGFELKADQSPVTVADRQAEAIIRERIARSYPGEAILGEEQGGSSNADRWIIDPIDGTKSFVCGVPLYATLLSYEQDAQPVVGVAYFPALDLMVCAERGRGSQANGRSIHVSQTTDLARTTLCCGGHQSMASHGRAEGFMSLAAKVMATRTWGDAYGHCLVAMGQVEAMIDPVVSIWDLSAVGLIVEEAGGKFTDFLGNSRPTHEAISSNGLLHDLLMRAFAP